MAGSTSSADARALLVSVWTSAGFAVGSLAWGWWLGSQLIVFDGLYSFASVGLSLLAVWALRISERGPDQRYPWGRQVWQPLALVVKAAVLAALCGYAVVSGVGDLLRGGREIAALEAVLYALMATAVGAAVSVYLRRRARAGSDLVRAEAAEWVGDSMLSLGVLAGFLLAVGLARAGRGEWARFVDPAMVVVFSLAFLRVPVGVLRSAIPEILTMAPDQHLLERLRADVEAVRRDYALVESFLRCAKVGDRLDVEIDYVVDDRSRAQTVRQFDEIRAVLAERLEHGALTTSMSVGFTADRRWVAD